LFQTPITPAVLLCPLERRGTEMSLRRISPRIGQHVPHVRELPMWLSHVIRVRPSISLQTVALQDLKMITSESVAHNPVGYL
jgi:hypothetical protein